MFRLLMHALAILHLGPGLAFAVLAFGCGDPPWWQAACGPSQIRSFVWLTLGGWVVLGAGSAWWLRRRKP